MIDRWVKVALVGLRKAESCPMAWATSPPLVYRYIQPEPALSLGRVKGLPEAYVTSGVRQVKMGVQRNVWEPENGY